MPSEEQKAASRANGARSRGPLTPEGKLRSSRSNVERALLVRTVVLESESRERFHALMTSLQEELKPETAIENLLVHKMAVAHWRLMRAWGLEKAGIGARPPANGIADKHVNVHEMRLDRQFTRALDRFEKFRAARTRQVPESKEPEAEI